MAYTTQFLFSNKGGNRRSRAFFNCCLCHSAKPPRNGGCWIRTNDLQFPLKYPIPTPHLCFQRKAGNTRIELGISASVLLIDVTQSYHHCFCFQRKGGNKRTRLSALPTELHPDKAGVSGFEPLTSRLIVDVTELYATPLFQRKGKPGNASHIRSGDATRLPSFPSKMKRGTNEPSLLLRITPKAPDFKADVTQLCATAFFSKSREPTITVFFLT